MRSHINSCCLDTTHHHPAAADTAVDTVVVKLNTVNPSHMLKTLPSTCPSDMTAYTPFALSPLGVSPSYTSYHTNPA
ncbi:hypothetical protein Tco_0301757 [Tanacetum coccineum]